MMQKEECKVACQSLIFCQSCSHLCRARLCCDQKQTTAQSKEKRQPESNLWILTVLHSNVMWARNWCADIFHGGERIQAY